MVLVLVPIPACECGREKVCARVREGVWARLCVREGMRERERAGRVYVEEVRKCV